MSLGVEMWSCELVGASWVVRCEQGVGDGVRRWRYGDH